MVIDLLEKSRVNVKELVLPTPEGKGNLPFDPERDISKDEWKEVEASYKFMIQGANDREFRLAAFITRAAEIKQLSTDHFANLGFEDIRAEAESWFIRDLERNRIEASGNLPHPTPPSTSWPGPFAPLPTAPEPNPEIFIGVTAATKELFPEIMPKHDLSVFKTFGDQKLAMHLEDNNFDDFLELAKNLRIVFPNTSFPDLTKKEIFDSCCIWLDSKVGKGKGDERDNYAITAANMKIAFPAMFSAQGIDWKQMYNDLKGWSTIASWASFIKEAAAMKILAAQKVEITDQGLVFIMPQSFQSETSALPQVRRF